MPTSLAHVPVVRGFEGTIFGATLADLIQMECLAMTTRAVRVEHNGRLGRIYFAGGQIVHAETGEFIGDAALVELLRWAGGRFTVEDGVRPIEDTIDRDWHCLLMEAAHCADELLSQKNNADPDMTAMPSPMNTAAAIFHDPDVLQGVQFTEDGTLLHSKSDDPDTMQSSFAYVAQMIRLIGGSLGMENLREIQVTGAESKALCMMGDDEITALIAGSKANLNALGKRLA